MTYEEKRDQYLNHVRTCLFCVDGYSKCKWDCFCGGTNIYWSVSKFCDEATSLLNAILP